MPITFNADEIFNMAEKIESNGAAFYRKAATLHPNPHNNAFLTKLAEMEDTHLSTFRLMHKELSIREREETAYDPMGEAMLYLGTMADQHGGEGSPSAAAALTGKETMEQILRIAMELERKSILFYIGLKDLVPAKLGKDKIDKIINEEKGHIVVLSNELKALQDKG
jgi:rubrerythrin